jgi:hypothetical protein
MKRWQLTDPPTPQHAPYFTGFTSSFSGFASAADLKSDLEQTLGANLSTKFQVTYKPNAF